MATLSRWAIFLSTAQFDGVEQVVVHLAGPLAVGGVDEILAEAGRAAVVDAEHRIAAVGQPLVIRVEAPAIARPRAAVHVEDHRHRLVRHAVVIRIGARRQRQVAHQVQAVAALDHAVVHLHERIVGQVVAIVEQEDHLPLRASRT